MIRLLGLTKVSVCCFLCYYSLDRCSFLSRSPPRQLLLLRFLALIFAAVSGGMLSVAKRGIGNLISRRAIALSAPACDVKRGNISNYKVVDHAYDAVVVGAGIDFLVQDLYFFYRLGTC